MSEAMRRHWADPEWRARQSQAIRRGLNPNRKGCLYLATVDDGEAIKIGFSYYPEERMRALRYQWQRDFVLLAEVPSTPAEERGLHRELAPHALRSLGAKEFYPVSILFHPSLPAAFASLAPTIPMWTA